MGYRNIKKQKNLFFSSNWGFWFFNVPGQRISPILQECPYNKEGVSRSFTKRFHTLRKCWKVKSDECFFLQNLGQKPSKMLWKSRAKSGENLSKIMTIKYQLSNSKQWYNAAICSNDFQSFQSELFSRLQLVASTPRWWLLSTLDRASLSRWRRGPLSIGE